MLQSIINAYKNDGHKVDGLFLEEVQGLELEEIIEIIRNAKGRDIIVSKPKEGVLDGLWYEYKGKVNPNFNFEKYL
ncbi:MAG: hypothetical protein PHZ26_01390 [Candidatus Gracilibacteria bacterium]|nr:hypothetical protein [Candidatus Gracilibacteria bacterium]MDD2908388.1 hypothetical protein [Candidatus Gracilibacteria bacterium]